MQFEMVLLARAQFAGRSCIPAASLFTDIKMTADKTPLRR